MTKLGWPFATPPNSAFTLNTASPLSRGLVLWMPFVAGRGGLARDMIRNRVATHYNAPTWMANAQMGPGLSFVSASSQYIGAISIPTLTTSNGFTMCGWIRYTGGFGATQYSLSATNPFTDCMIGYAAFSGWRAVMGATNLTEPVEPDTQLQHIALVSHSATDHRFYRNGRQVATSATNVSIDLEGYEIGRQSRGASSYWQGEVYNSAIYNRALSPGEIWALYNPATRWELYRPAVRRFNVGTPAAPAAVLSPYYYLHLMQGRRL